MLPRAPYSFVGSPNPAEGPRQRLSIGIVNNMPDAAFEATERQFVKLLKPASRHFDIRIQLFTLPGIARGEVATRRIRGRYLDHGVLRAMHMDALIVTGAVPVRAALVEEPYWPEFVDLVERARTRTLSTIWSCLAAHAAAHHLDGIERVRLPRKLSGVFEVTVRAQEMFGKSAGDRYAVPHSRYNCVRESDLTRAGYRILAGSPDVGADIFEKETPSRFVFLQGHPEYAPDTLFREYRRDIGKYASGASPEIPSLPAGYFSDPVGNRLRQLAHDLMKERDTATRDMLPDPQPDWTLQQDWSAHAADLMTHWITWIAGRKSLRHRSAEGVA